MRLPISNLDLPTELLEFDIWITPTLGEIRDTNRFKVELENIAHSFDLIGDATRNFADINDCSPAMLADTFIKLLEHKSIAEARKSLEVLASVLFLVTGKSDNNAKCQLPIYLRDRGWEIIPTVKRSRGTRTLARVPLPRELKADKYMGIVADLGMYQDTHKPLTVESNFEDYRKKLLEEFIRFILNDEGYISQLWSIGHSYFMLKAFRKEYNLLSPLVIFQVRGSVAASGGHDPEELLRRRLAEWGLQADIDYNSADVKLLSSFGTVIPEEESSNYSDNQETPKIRKKTRAYDFTLPFRTPGWKPKIFIQCQFYAGDSGSVSHKNVDQTSTSRREVLMLVPDAKFIEYVDGAGYFSSLNGDLKSLLAMPTTNSFTQVRSAAIRLRRELQHLGFLAPLEVEHAILRSDGSISAIHRILAEEGYSQQEIQRCYMVCIQNNLLTVENNGSLSLIETRRTIARRYFILDVVAHGGAAPNATQTKLTGSLMIPGYGPFYGMKLDTIGTEALRLAPNLREDWSNPETIMGDIRWLSDEGLAMSS